MFPLTAGNSIEQQARDMRRVITQTAVRVSPNLRCRQLNEGRWAWVAAQIAKPKHGAKQTGKFADVAAQSGPASLPSEIQQELTDL
jgi:hypothetical protein